MQINITARHIKLTNGLADYVNKKVGQLQKYLNNIVNAQVKMDVAKYRHTIEIILHSEGNIFKSVATGGDMYSAADIAVGKIENQLRRHKEKIKKRRVTSVRTILATHAGGIPEEEYKLESEQISAAFPAQAVNRLRAQDRKYLLFLNPETDKINLIYKKENGKYVIVEPEY